MNINIKPISNFVKKVKQKYSEFSAWNKQEKFQKARERGHKYGANNTVEF